MEVNERVINLNSKTVFTLHEANSLLDIVNKITAKYQNILNENLKLIEQEQNSNIKAELKIAAQEIIDRWNMKIKKLGAKPTGIWNADFDFGEGYYCWRYPENSISHWHGYSEGFINRKTIDELPNHTH